MARLSGKLRSISNDHGGIHRTGIAHWCPACKRSHGLWTLNPERPEWQWNGNAEAPTVTPSVRLFWPAQADSPEETICHYFLSGGQIQYCGDSRHELAGQTVPLPDWPEGYDDGDR